MKSKENLTTFDECKLERKKYADVLTSIVATYKDGFVLAVNGKWGTGKTTFMKMWQNELNNQGYRTIFFNAWENDFTSEPLVALLGEIKSLTTTEADQAFDNILEKAAKFASTVIPALTKTVATHVGYKDIADAISKISEATVSIMNDEIKCYDEKKKSLQGIREDLAKFVKEKCGDKPLIFIIDELDRCRPDYAVEILEKIKHLFSVDGIVFVLSIDKEQLKHAVKGYYGSEGIDSSEYLRRFIDLEYTLPEPDYKKYITYLCDNEEIASEAANMNLISNYIRKENYSLRQIEKIFKVAKIAMNSTAEYLHFNIALFLVTIKEFRPQLYRELKSSDIDVEIMAKNLGDEFKSLMILTPQEKSGFSRSFVHCIIYPLLVLYANNKEYGCISRYIDGKGALNIDIPNVSEVFKNARLDLILNSPCVENYGTIIRYTSKIDLLETLNI